MELFDLRERTHLWNLPSLGSKLAYKKEVLSHIVYTSHYCLYSVHIVLLIGYVIKYSKRLKSPSKKLQYISFMAPLILCTNPSSTMLLRITHLHFQCHDLQLFQHSLNP